MLQNKIIRSVLGGALGGLLAWMLSEPVYALTYHPTRDITQILWSDALWAAPVGIALGLVLGAAEGLSLRSLLLTVRGSLIGMGIGLIGGLIGVVFAEIVFQQIQWLCFIGRGIGWSIFGFFLGLSEGIRRFSLRGTRNAALGGALGGFVGGVLFDLVGIPVAIFTWMLGIRGGDGISRAIALIVLGACIGILIALVERVLAEAALRVTAGRQEGREILLDKPRTTLGHDERNDIYLSDMGVAPRHAEIRAEGRGYAITPAGGTVLVNQIPVTHHTLQPGDQIQLGAVQLVYRARKGRVPVRPIVPARVPRVEVYPPIAENPRHAPMPPGPPQLPVPTKICPRCAHTNRAGAKFCQRCRQPL